MGPVESEVRVEIPVQGNANSILRSRQRKDLLVRSFGQADLADVEGIPTLGSQQVRRAGRQTLVEQNSFHATRNQSIPSSRFAAAN